MENHTAKHSNTPYPTRGGGAGGGAGGGGAGARPPPPRPPPPPPPPPRRGGPDLVIGVGSVWESRGVGAAMLAVRELSSSSSALLPPLLSFEKSPCKRPAFGVGVAAYIISHTSL